MTHPGHGFGEMSGNEVDLEDSTVRGPQLVHVQDIDDEDGSGDEVEEDEASTSQEGGANSRSGVRDFEGT